MNEIKGNLFEHKKQPNEIVVHCVSRDLYMGRGIAVEFRKRFGHVRDLLAQKKGRGEMAVLKVHNDPMCDLVGYLITKERCFEKPSYQDLYESIRALRCYCQNNGIQKVVMPRIGCGLDGFDWEKDVYPILNKMIIKEANASIDVYVL